MKAGPYIKSTVEFHLTMARDFRRRAEELENEASVLRFNADEQERSARRWAYGTDIEIKHTLQQGH